MGSFRNGDGTPPSDNGGIPDLPPEWGVVLIPDDPAELDRESSQLRREQRRSVRRAKWRRRFGLPPKVGHDDDNPPVGTPLLIMAIAIVAALTSLFAITLSTRTNSGTNTPPTPAAPAVTPQMIDLSLPDATGREHSLLAPKHPEVILILDGFANPESLITDTANSAPKGARVVVIDTTAPQIPAGVTTAIALADRQQVLLSTFGGGADHHKTPAGQVTALLVDSAGTVTNVVNHANGIDAFREDLLALN
jgi:hypothetical protein